MLGMNRDSSKISDLPFDADANQVVADAAREAERLGHVYVGAEHLVLALARPEKATLSRFGIDPAAVRDMIETTITRGRGPIDRNARLPYTSRTQKALSLAMERGRARGEQLVSIDALLFGILEERANIGAQVLGHFGLTADRVAQSTNMTTDSSTSSTASSFVAESLDASLTVKDVAKSLAWYRDVLGFAVDRTFERDGRMFAASLRAGNVRILVNQDDGSKGLDRVKGEGFSLRLTTLQDVDAVAARVKAAGGTLDAEPADGWGARVFRLRDPDGFRFVVSSKPAQG